VYNKIKKDGKLPIGVNRFLALRSSCNIDLESLQKIAKIFSSYWKKPGLIVTVDEAVWDFQPRQKTKKKAENSLEHLAQASFHCRFCIWIHQAGSRNSFGVDKHHFACHPTLRNLSGN